MYQDHANMILNFFNGLTKSPRLIKNEKVKETAVWKDFLDFNDTITFVKDSCALLEESDDIQRDFNSQIAKIKSRADESSLYVAVIGEFDSGKSTFINTLLRADILKTSYKVATGVETHIRYRKIPDVNVKFINHRSMLYRLKNRKTSELFEKLFNPAYDESEYQNNDKYDSHNQKDLADFIQKYTQSEADSKGISKVTLHYPSGFLKNDIVLIDTPGINATDKRHEEITKRIIEDSADLFLIVTQSWSPLSECLIRFLNEHLEGRFNQCLFIATQMDKLNFEDIKAQEDYIRNMIYKVTGVEEKNHPVLYSCAALPALRHIVESSSDPTDIEWANRFFELEAKLKQQFNRSRKSGILSSLSSRTRRILNQLDEAFKRERNQLSTDLDGTSIQCFPHISEFVHEQKKDVRLEIQKTIEKIKTESNKHINALVIQAGDKFEQAFSQNLTRKYLMRICRDIAFESHGSYFEKIEEEIKMHGKHLISTQRNSQDRFKESFSKAYRMMIECYAFVFPDQIFNYTTKFKLHIYSPFKRVTDIIDRAENRGKFFNWIFGPSIAEMKKFITDAFNEDLSDLYEQITSKVEIWAGNQEDSTLKAVLNYIEKTIKQYETFSEDYKQQQLKTKHEISQQIEILYQKRKEIDDRLIRLTQNSELLYC